MVEPLPEKKKLELKLAELDQIYELTLELLKKTQDPEELFDAVMDEYARRFAELPGVNLNTDLEDCEDEVTREKARALILFARLASLVKENADYQAQLKKRNRELAELTTRLQQANSRLQRLNSHYLNMLSFVSHELRSPLISILGFAELLDEGLLGDLNDEQANSVQIIIRVTRNLIEMIRNYLDLAKIEKGELRIHWQKVEVLHSILLPVIHELEGHLLARDMRIIPAPEGSCPRQVFLEGDPALLKIVFTNIFGNAIKYGKRRTAIEYEIEDRGKEYFFAIRNEGKGVPADHLELIFEKFSQGSQHFADAPRGTGLGLFNTRCIVEAHGGRIWAESEYGKWFRICMTLPRRPERRPEYVPMDAEISRHIPGCPEPQQNPSVAIDRTKQS